VNETKTKNNVKMSKKERLNYYFLKNRYYSKIGFKRNNILLSFLSFFYCFFIKMLLPIGFFVFLIIVLILDIKYEIVEKNDLLSFIKEDQIDTLFVSALTLFGIWIAAYSIILEWKSKYYFGKNIFKDVLSSRCLFFDLKYFIIMGVYYFAGAILGYSFGRMKSPIVGLLIVTMILVIETIILSIRSNAKIFYLNNRIPINKNPFVNRRKNYLEIINKVGDNDNNNLIDAFIEETKKDMNVVNISLFFDEFSKEIFYKRNIDVNFYSELFKLYIHNYFKILKNDSQLIGIMLICPIIEKLIENVDSKKEYEIESLFMYSFLEEFNNFLKCRRIKKKMQLPSERLVSYCIKAGNKELIQIIERNSIILNGWKISYKDSRERFNKNISFDNFYDGDKKKIQSLFEDNENLIVELIEKNNDFLNVIANGIKDSVIESIKLEKESDQKCIDELHK